MAIGKITQSKTSYVDASGTTQFQIYSLFYNNVGIDDGIFVFEIIDPLNPALDEFVRVAAAGDLDDWEGSRPLAVAAGEDFYRSSALTVHYADPQTAIDASTVIVEKVTELLDDYTNLTTNFFGTVVTTVPTTNGTLLSQMIQAAEDQHVVYVAAQATTAADLVVYNAAVVDLDAAEINYNTVIDLYDEVLPINAGLISRAATAVLGYNDAIAANLHTNATYTTAWTSINSVINSSSGTSLPGWSPLLNTFFGNLVTFKNILTTNRTSTQTAVNTARQAHVLAQADEAAQLALRTDLATDVLDIDPTHVFSWI